MTRLKAASIHILISLAIVSILITLMFKVWYPDTYFKLMGGKNLIFLIAGVDVVLGPLLTLIVFKSGKPSLKFDLACIGLIQVCAMCYGLNVMFEARPVFTVFNKTTFQVVAALDIDYRELPLGKKEEWRTLSITGPRLVAIATPDKKLKKEYIFAGAVSDEACRYPRLYDYYSKHVAEVIKVGKPLDLLYKNPINKKAVDTFVSKYKRRTSEFLYIPAASMVTDMVAVIDAKSGDLVEIIDAKAHAKN